MIIQNTKNSQQFVKENTSAHWYQVKPDGTVLPRYGSDLKQARVERLYTSPTSIDRDIRANPFLQRWIKNEIAKSFINNPRLPGENDDGYAERVLKLADAIRDAAAARGTAIHEAIEKNGTTDMAIYPFYQAYLPWHARYIEETLGSEEMLYDARIGVAGRTDRRVRFADLGLAIIDYKTQNIKPDGKPMFYDGFPRQLSFYAKAHEFMHGELPRIVSVVINSVNPSLPVHKIYTKEEQDLAYKEFLCHVWLWCNSKPKGGFWPCGRWDIQAVFQNGDRL